MKKLLFVISQLYKGGAETSLVNLLNRLDHTKYRAELLILNQSPVEHAVSLTGQIDPKVKVCDAYKEFQKLSAAGRVRAKFVYTMEQKGAYYVPALDFVRNKMYDWAFFVGEWYSPSFVAYEVQARIKAAWIHNDLSEAEYFDAGHYFYFADRFDYFIFVSQNSLLKSVEAYPFLKEKAVCIYNVNNTDTILKRAQEEPQDWPKSDLPVLLTCANFRPQKNHLHQVKVMAELKRRGVEFLWMNIGAMTDQGLVSEVKKLCRKEGLDKCFIIAGPKENPYQYMKRADAVTVLSDYESWSMVITEAKILGVPVIASGTSGALEQIEDGKTGIITEFSIKSMADQIERFLKSSALRKRICDNIRNFDNTKSILHDFYQLLENGRRYAARKRGRGSILYIIDDINYMGGAHIATKLQIRELVRQGRKVSVFAGNIPRIDIREELKDIHFLSPKDFREDIIFNKRTADCMTCRKVLRKERMRKLRQLFAVHICRDKKYYEEHVLPNLKKLFSKYETVCVMSEGSVYRHIVAQAECRKKIQWIHIDYCAWKEKTEWNRKITKDDGEIYKKFDRIVVLTEGIKETFLDLYPHLREKVVVNRNLIPVEQIRAGARAVQLKNTKPVRFVTVGRIDYQKAYPRLVRILARLRQEGYNFRWTIIGGGKEADVDAIKKSIEREQLDEWVKMPGELKNPYLQMREADIFALLSDFEGIPNTIYEALILGMPVLATDVGGVSTQIEDGVNGWLVENKEACILDRLAWVILHPDEVCRVRENNRVYFYDNEHVLENNRKIFSY